MVLEDDDIGIGEELTDDEIENMPEITEDNINDFDFIEEPQEEPQTPAAEDSESDK